MEAIAGALRAWRYLFLVPAMLLFWTYYAVVVAQAVEALWASSGDLDALPAGVRFPAAVRDITGTLTIPLVTVLTVAGALRAPRSRAMLRAAGALLVLDHAAVLVYVLAAVETGDVSGWVWWWLGLMTFAALALIVPSGPRAGPALVVHVLATLAAIFTRLLWPSAGEELDVARTGQLVEVWLSSAEGARWQAHLFALCTVTPLLVVSRGAVTVAEDAIVRMERDEAAAQAAEPGPPPLP